jgi:hypothetical protein
MADDALGEAVGDEVPAPRPVATEVEINFAGRGGRRALDGNYRAHGFHPDYGFIRPTVSSGPRFHRSGIGAIMGGSCANPHREPGSAGCEPGANDRKDGSTAVLS